MNNQATQEKLTQMRLWGMQRAFRGVLEGGIGAKYTADELIGHLVVRSGMSATTAGWRGC